MNVAWDFGVDAHCAAEGLADLLRLAGQEGGVLSLDESRSALAPLVAVCSGVAADEVLPADDREPHAGVQRRIADHRLGLAAAGHELGLFQHPLTHYDDAAVA